MSKKWDTTELYGKVAEALAWAYDEAVLDEEVGLEAGEGFPVILQYDVETNEVIARFAIEEIKFREVQAEGGE